MHLTTLKDLVSENAYTCKTYASMMNEAAQIIENLMNWSIPDEEDRLTERFRTQFEIQNIGRTSDRYLKLENV